MINKYKFNDDSSIQPHFKVKEFQCKCGNKHDTLLDSDLVAKLEKLHIELQCDKIIVNSGYRCPTHDRNVGGSGSGKHVDGCAADIVCYRDGKVLSSKIVCCAAQDIGFNGIANIDRTYTATHVDVGSRKWYGDENVTTQYSVTDDFYKHFGITKSDVYKNVKSKISVTIEFEDHKYSGLLEEG